MDEYTSFETKPGAPRWVGVVLGLVAVVALAALGEGYVASSRAKTLEQTLNGQTQNARQSASTLNEKLAEEEDASAQMRGELSVVTDRLQLTQTDLAHARQQATLIKAEDARKLEAVQAELAAKASSDDVNKLGTDVNGVKTDLAKTQASLTSSTTDLGTMIAHNHDEVQQLRALGERNYYEFTIDGKGTRQKVGDLQVELRGTNEKKNQFTVRLYADDKQFEKKNRAMDEPIYFYTSDSKTPLELVVNQVRKNQVSGYLSVPKTTAQQQTPAASLNLPQGNAATVTAQAQPK
jgi:chromosome segregation ATPase